MITNQVKSTLSLVISAPSISPYQKSRCLSTTRPTRTIAKLHSRIEPQKSQTTTLPSDRALAMPKWTLRSASLITPCVAIPPRLIKEAAQMTDKASKGWFTISERKTGSRGR